MSSKKSSGSGTRQERKKEGKKKKSRPRKDRKRKRDRFSSELESAKRNAKKQRTSTSPSVVTTPEPVPPTPAPGKFVQTLPLQDKNIATSKRLRKKQQERAKLRSEGALEKLQRHLHNDELDPGPTPGSAASKMRYGARLPVAPVQTLAGARQNDPEAVPHTADMPREEAERLGYMGDRALNMGNITDHFASAWQFEESTPSAITPAHLEVGDSRRGTESALELDDGAHAPGRTASVAAKATHEALAAAFGVVTRHGKRDAEASAIAAENARKQRKATEARNAECKRRRAQRKKQVEARIARGEAPLFDVSADTSIRDPTELPLEDELEAYLARKEEEQREAEGPREKPPLLKLKRKIPAKHAKDAMLRGGTFTTNADLDTASWRGLRKATPSELRVFMDRKNSDLQIHNHPTGRYKDKHEAPPSNNSIVHARRRTLLARREAFDAEAGDAIDPTKQDGRPSASCIPQTTADGTPLEKVDGPMPTVLHGTETRQIRVVNDYDRQGEHPVQDICEDAGDRMAMSDIQPHLYPAKAPVMGITDARERALEDGFNPDRPALGNMEDEAEIEGLPRLNVDEADTLQPMIRLVQTGNEKARDVAIMDFAQQLVMDLTRFLGDVSPVLDRWARDPDTGKPRTTINHIKELSSAVKGCIRSARKEREIIGRRVTYDRPHLSVRRGHLFAEYCLSLLREHDIFFANDRVLFAHGAAMVNGETGSNDPMEVDDAQEDGRVIMPYRPKSTAGDPARTQKLIEASRYGLLGSLTARLLRKQLELHPDRVGTDHHMTVFDLGTNRLHPSCNPLVVKVSLAYHLRYMEERDPSVSWQRDCVNGSECWCYSQPTRLADQSTTFTLNSSAKFVCRQFLLPDEECTARFEGKLPDRPRSCIVCYMSEVAARVSALEYDGIIPKVPVNNHSVEVDVEGGYRKEDCYPLFYTRQHSKSPTGISGFFPIFSESQFRHRERREGNRLVRYVSYSPSMTGFR